MCGGDLVIEPGATVAECEYCGTRQTIPNQDDEKKLTLFARANRLRMGCEFDKAAGIYESIVADFPQEAEAYWGLVLCKYGIEYVDDPATGKKIPTCHRSSFESIMEDSDFEQALENADVVARKVYREEAKQIEEIRKGIIEVSGKEEPYDIFICYKETDENGERTIDSVIAQDVYDALTEKGYRVFFSRITLEDKLGQEYEPYIFAALNSAKIMLAFGTDYEYYNAVWVKNEWSRYLKLMASDKSKHLIPCYKGIDAYDMPGEFAKLQAQDMGKIGAMQDLLWGIEKILPKQQPVTVVQERVVVGGSGDNKIASLLDRGNMALEDGDWNKADSFFEDVLNNDSKNAQAYLGKTLVQQRCRTIDALVRKRLAEYEQVKPETLSIPEQSDHIAQMVGKYTIPGYVTAETIGKYYEFNGNYSSEVSGRKTQYRQEEAWWAEHKQLSRAEKFAAGAVAENLAAAKKMLFAALADRVKKAQQADAEKTKELENAYAAAIQAADREAETCYQDGLARREADYQSWLEGAKTEQNPQRLLNLAKQLDTLDGYKDSTTLAQHCEKRAQEEQAKVDAEIERQKTLARQREQAAAAKRKKTRIAVAIAMVAVIAAVLVVTKVIIPGSHYKAAEELLAAGDYAGAAEAFAALGAYKDAPERVLATNYAEAEALLNAGNFDDAAEAFAALGAYEDAPERVLATNYAEAEALLNAGNFDDAAEAFAALSEYEDAAERASAIYFTKAQSLLAAGDNTGAAIAFGQAGDYQDAKQQSMDLWNTYAVRETVGAGASHTVGLKADGTVVAVGYNNFGRCDVSGWADIVAISAGSSYTVGLKSDGTVVAVGYNDDGQCDVSGWTDIVAIRAGDSHTVGLKADGTVVAVGYNKYGQCDVSGWTDIVAISTGIFHTVGLKSDGTVVAVGYNEDGQCDVSGWKNIVAIRAGTSHTVGLKADGTVVAVGYNEDGQCDVSGWTDIVAIRAGYYYTVGLKADGTVVAVGKNEDGQCDVSGWKNIVAIRAGGIHTVGLKADGTVVAVGDNMYGQCDVSGWKDIVAIRAGYYHTVGLKSDGTVVAVGYNKYGQCDVSQWKNIKIPAAATIR